jgi:hypothetical protein
VTSTMQARERQRLKKLQCQQQDQHEQVEHEQPYRALQQFVHAPEPQATQDAAGHQQQQAQDQATSVYPAPGYPTQPYYVAVAHALHQWAIGRQQPIRFQHYCELESPLTAALLLQFEHQVTPLIIDCLCNWSHEPIADSNLVRLASIVQRLEIRGILSLLGVRTTTGSLDRLPPSRASLLASFSIRNSTSGSSKLTTGARALTKHSIRCATSWWGDTNGGEEYRNALALRAVQCILDNAAWINMHLLPHSVEILEVRHTNGYGARWTADGSFFRGFLEPQQSDGHEKGIPYMQCTEQEQEQA